MSDDAIKQLQDDLMDARGRIGYLERIESENAQLLDSLSKRVMLLESAAQNGPQEMLCSTEARKSSESSSQEKP